MKKINKLTLCAMLGALATVFMLTAYFPYITYSVPLAASVFVMIAVIESGKRWGLFTYVVTAALTLLFAELQAKLIFVCFAGFYPVLKAIFEGFRSRIPEFVLKFVTFNFCVITVYLLFAQAFGLSEMSDFGIYGLLILLLGANFVFLIYDVILTRLASFYMWRLHHIVERFKKK